MRLILAVALATAAATAVAQEFPKLKAGLWTTTITSANGQKQDQRVSTLCLDDSVQQEMYKMSTGAMAGMCSKHDLKVSANTITSDAICDLGQTRIHSQSVMTLTGNTAYRTEAKVKFEPPMNGMAETNTVLEGRHVGACKAGQKPGDMTLPDGRSMNIRQMMGGRG